MGTPKAGVIPKEQLTPHQRYRAFVHYGFICAHNATIMGAYTVQYVRGILTFKNAIHHTGQFSYRTAETSRRTFVLTYSDGNCTWNEITEQLFCIVTSEDSNAYFGLQWMPDKLDWKLVEFHNINID